MCRLGVDYLDKHQPCGLSLERIRGDRILREALATGADPLHLTLVFSIDHTNAMAYASAACNLLSGPAEQALLSAARAGEVIAYTAAGIVTVAAVIVTGNITAGSPACRLPAGYR